jgi:hypothetical protein
MTRPVLHGAALVSAILLLVDGGWLLGTGAGLLAATVADMVILWTAKPKASNP